MRQRGISHLVFGHAGLLVVMGELVLVVQEELEGLLRDGAVGEVANDAHSRGKQKSADRGLVRVVRFKGLFPSQRAKNQGWTIVIGRVSEY